MAIYHLSVKNISRNSGRSSVSAAAYRAGDKITNEQDGVTHDFLKKRGIAYSTIMIPENAPKEYQNRSVLWNAIEKSETTIKSRTAREIEIALPNELNLREQVKLVEQYVKDNFIDQGMCADISIHSGHKNEHPKDKEDYAKHDKDIKPNNPHVHILLTTRPINQNGEWGAKSKKEYVLNKKGERIKLPSGRWKSKKIDLVDWNKSETLLQWRKNWAIACNKEFERKNLSVRIDHRSYKDQGIEKQPMVHMGVEATQMERKGIKTEKGEYNREVRAMNTSYQNNLQELERQVTEIKAFQRQMHIQQSAATKREHERQLAEKEKLNDELAKEVREKIDHWDEQQERYSVYEDENRGAERQRGYQEYENQNTNDIQRTQPKEQQIQQKTNQPRADRDRYDIEPAETVAGRLNDLRSDYINLEVQTLRIQEARGELQNVSMQAQSKAESIEEKLQLIKQYSQKINQLQADREQLGMFSGKEKRSINDQIRRLEQSKAQVQSNLKREWGGSDQSTVLKQILQQQSEIKKQLDSLPNIKKLKEQQNVIGQAYKQEIEGAMTRPDKNYIQDLMNRNKGQVREPKNLNEKIAISKAESKLQNIITKKPTKSIEKNMNRGR